MARKHVNTLYTGDCLLVMNGLNSSSVDLIYLDPPFNSKRMYSAPIGSRAAGASFKDMWSWQDVDEICLEHMVEKYPHLVRQIESTGDVHGKPMMAYVTYMAQRLVEAHRLLKDSGSIYLHCDPAASHYLKIIMDGIFGRQYFQNEIVWTYGLGGSSKRKWSKKHDVILFYSKSGKYYFDKPTTAARSVKMRGQQKGMLDVWTDIPSINNMSKERTGYPTQKPEALLERIIKASSQQGNIVFDPFCGCATTCAVAEKLGRGWVGIDIAKNAVGILVERLSDSSTPLFSNFVHRSDLPRRTDIVVEKVDAKGVKARLYREQKGACGGCGSNFAIQHFEVDHIVPKSKGGGDYYENYQLLCGHCNRIKGNKPMEYLRAKIAARRKHLKTNITFEELEDKDMPLIRKK